MHAFIYMCVYVSMYIDTDIHIYTYLSIENICDFK